MIATKLIEHMDIKRRRGLVFAVGGCADIILAKNLAESLIKQGCSRVDLVQPLNCKTLSEKVLLAKASEIYALEAERGIDPEAVLRHHASIPSERYPNNQRGKGINISAALEWNHGIRYVCATHAGGVSLLAARQEAGKPFYDFAVGVDGGGDVLTHGNEEFDRVVLSEFRAGWNSDRSLILVVMGLGADGASSPEHFQDVSLDGWRLLLSTSVDACFAASLQRDLEQLGLWHASPSTWDKDDPQWGYGLKVPQIIALASRNIFPFDREDRDPRFVMFPRRWELKRMDRGLLCEVRLFLSKFEQR